MDAGSGGDLRPVDQRRIIAKVNECMSRKDYPGVERTLRYWLAEARAGGDRRGELMIQNELVGHYRKTGEKDKALESAGEALRLLDELGYAGSLSEGTACVNVATAYSAFGENEAALRLFRRARAAYESGKNVDPALLGGLYNNMGLALAALERYGEAMDLFEKALVQMEKAPGGALEMAVTMLNMADAVEKRDGPERGEGEIFPLLDRAEALLKEGDFPRDGYCAYVYERCAPAFAYYGYFLAAEWLKKQAEAIYEGA